MALGAQLQVLAAQELASLTGQPQADCVAPHLLAAITLLARRRKLLTFNAAGSSVTTPEHRSASALQNLTA